MYEFDAVSVSTYEAASLAAKLTEKSADGWEVVAIVPAGSDITAYLRKGSGGAVTPSTSEDVAATPAATEATPASTSATAEPAGWGSAPAATSTPITNSTSSWGATTTDTSSGGWGSTAAATPAQAAQPATSTPSVPAGWYHDPAGRFELRYWDGSAWTEHVSRAGQQYTDPPVA